MSETPSSSYSVNHPNSSESEQSLSTRHFNVTEPVVAKRICFYKSGDPQFNGIKMVVNSRSYKTFDALLDSLSKRVPLPFGVRNISTPRGRHSITSLEDLEDGKSYICSHQRKMKPINLEQASKKPLPWQISRPVSARCRAVQLARQNEDGFGHRESRITTPKKMLVFKNGDVRLRRTIVLGKKNTQTFEAFLDYMSELMQYPVAKIYTTDGRKVPNLQALILCSGAVVAAGREPFKPSNYESLEYLRPAKLLGIGNRVYPKANAKSESEKMRAEMDSSSRSQIFSVSSDKGSSNDNNSNDNNSDSSYALDSHNGIEGNRSVIGEDLSVAQYQDDIEKSVHVNQDGSITVEMKVRFKIKEEETIKWTTTVSRAGLSDDKNISICESSAMNVEDCSSNVKASDCINPKDAPFLKSYNKEEEDLLQQSNEEVSDKESESDLKTADCNVSEKSNSADLDVGNVPEEDIRPRFYRPPTPGPRRVRQKKAVVESVTLVSEKEVQEKTIGQFSYSEEIENGEKTSEYCMVAHSSRKKSSVSNPKLNEVSDDGLLKLSSENIKEEMLFKVSHKSSELVETTNRKTLEVPDENELVQNILEKSAVGQGAYSSLVSTSKANSNGFIPSSKTYQTARPGTADHIHKSCDIKQIKRSVSSFITYSELCQSKEEIKCQAADLITISQDSVHSACGGHSQMKMMAPPYSKAPTEKVNPTTGFFPTVSESENQISARTESVMKTLIENSQSTSSLTKKKKKKRKSSSFLEQGTYEYQKHQDISGIIKSEGLHITQESTIEAMDKYSEMPQKEGTEYFIKNNDGLANSQKSMCPEDESYPQDSVEQNGLSSSNKKKRSNNKKLAKVKLNSGKKSSIISSAKSEDGLMTADSNNESELSQDTLSIEKEGTHLISGSFEQTPHSPVTSKPLSEVPKNLSFEKEKNNLEHLSSKKEKKQKAMKKNRSKGVDKRNMSESAITLEALSQEGFQGEVVGHLRENYVQTWLKNSLSNSVLPPIKKKEGTVENSNAHSSAKENTDASVEKEARFITNNVHVTGEKHLLEDNLTKKPLKPIGKLRISEDSAKDSDERQTGSWIHCNTSIVEEAKYSLKSEFHQDGKLHLFHEAHDNDKKMAEVDIQITNLCHRKKSEVAVQADCTIVSEKIGTDVQNNCMSSMLLHELQSTLLGLQKEHSGCIGKACSFSDFSPSAFGSSSNALLAWLLLLNLRERLTGTITDDMQKNACSCSEIFTQLKCLKQTAAIEQADELKAVFSHLQQSTENKLLHFKKELEKQDSTHENMTISEIPNGIHLNEHEESVDPCIAMDNVNSEETLKLTGESESCFDIEKDLCKETETLDMIAPKTQLDGQSANTNSNTCSLPSAIETPERNEEMPDSLYEKTQDTSFINEESESSVEPNSTVHSVTSNDNNFILDQDTSELEGEKEIVHVTADKSEDEDVDPKSADTDKTPKNQLTLDAETSVEYNNEDYSVQDDKEDAEISEQTSERLSTVSPLSFRYESKQITECDMTEGEQKLQVEEVENKMCSDTSPLKKCLKSPATSDWSDYRPDTEESDYNFRASSDLTNESGEEALEKHYNTGYVKRTIERLYGKTEASFKPDFHKGFPYMSKVFQMDTEGFHSAVGEKIIYFSQEPMSCSAEKLSHSSLPSQEYPVNVNKDDSISRRGNTPLPTSQSTPNREETSYPNDCFGESPNQHCQPSIQASEDEGILIDKGKWLLKENHLIRRSPPERIGMYGNLDTTSVETNSDEAPYYHFGNLDQYPALDEIPSSELEDMVKPPENFCSYFNMPHNSDSDPFQDELNTKGKRSRNGKILPVATKEKTDPSAMVGSASTQADTNFPAFSSVEFRLPDNKVHPLEKPLNAVPIQSQPTNVSNVDRSALHEEDSLDRLHAICGQHCPILMVTVIPVNEEQRGYAYQKASDIENQLGLYLLAKKSEHLEWSGQDLTDKNNYVTLKSNSIMTVYEVCVTTGDLWNAGTEAYVCISVCGERGDTGSRELLRSQKFLKGQTNILAVEAVHLGHLYKIVKGHSGLGSGGRDVARERPSTLQAHKEALEYLEQVAGPETGDQGNRNVARELPVTDAHTFPGSLFDINVKRRNICIFSSHQMPSHALALVRGHVTGKSKVKACCELHVHLQPSGCAILESASYPGHTVAFNLQGKVAAETTGYAGLSEEFVVRVKGTGDEYCHFKIEKNLETGSINLRGLGQLYKIPIGHDSTGKDPSWYLEEVRLERVVPVSDEEIYLAIESWLSEDRDEGDTWREVAIRNPAEELLPLLVYEVHVYTGAKLDAETDSNVYINLIGTRGDAGKRKLHRSKNNNVKFRHGQMDIFCIKAVSLGDLEKVLISHDGAGPGSVDQHYKPVTQFSYLKVFFDTGVQICGFKELPKQENGLNSICNKVYALCGWFLDKIVIKHKGEDAQEVVFPCNRPASQEEEADEVSSWEKSPTVGLMRDCKYNTAEKEFRRFLELVEEIMAQLVR
ncbi:oxygen-regulated protein 1 [Aphelocoma coerulescens]|uniref:oxygen-regulated protein 1 n=1 Tax=Aphelocoma coerulescens TaxID=39617 RepID=UPI0036049551